MPITPKSKVSAAPDVKENAEPGKPLPPQREKPSAGILTNAVHQLQAPEKSQPAPPRLPPGAAPLAPASTFQAPAFPFQTNPFQTNGAVHGAIADTAPRKPTTVAQASTQQPHPAQQSTQAPADALSDADKREIDRWLSDNDPASAGEIVDKLRSLSKSKPRQQYLIDRAFNLDKQASRNLIPFSRVGDLVRLVLRDAPTLHAVVAERLMNCAINSQRRLEGDGTLDDPHNQARACALHALDAMRGNDRELGQLVASLEDGALFGQALGNGNRSDSGLMSEARNRVLAALNSVPHTETTSAVVGTLCSQTVPTDIWRTPRLADNIATALAREWHLDEAGKIPAEEHRLSELAEKKRLEDLMEARQGVQLLFGGLPDRNLTTLLTIQYSSRITAQALAGDTGEWVKNPVVAGAIADRLVPSDAPDRGATVKRLADILAIDNGQQLLFGQYGFDHNIPDAARAEALQAMLSDPSITARTLTETDPWTNPQLVMDIARARAAKAGIRNDEPTQFNGYNNLSNFVGRAMGLRPPDEDDLDGLLGVITGSKSVYPQENVQAVVNQIRHLGGLNPKITFVPVTFSSRDMGPVEFALFRVETGVQKISSDGSSISEAVYVDHLGRVYKTIGDGVAAPGTKRAEPSGWIAENKLPEGVVVYPKNGHVSTDPSGALIFAHTDTPRHPVKNALNKVALVGGIVAGGLIIVGTGGTATVLLGAGCSLWGLNSAREELTDRAHHGQGNSWRNAEARALWLSLAANATGVAALAGGALLRPLLAQAGRLGKISTLTVGGVNWTATVTNAAAIIDTGIDLVTNPPEDPRAAILDLAFRATVGVVGARHAGGFGEALNPVANVRRITEAYRPHVERTSALPGNRVQIENVNGRRVIFASPTAPQELIDLHIEIARMMALDQGIIGLLARGVFGGAKPGTLAYAVQYELIKLGKLTKLLNARLNEPNPKSQQRDSLEREIEIYRAYGEKVIKLLADHPNAGEIPVASPDTASAINLEALGDNARDALKKLADRAAAAEQMAATKAIREYYEALKKVSGPEAALDRVSLQMMIDAYELMRGHDADLLAKVKDYLKDLVGKENIADIFKPVAASRGLPATGSVAQVPADIDLDNFFPNPKAPNGPVLLKHDRVSKIVGSIIAAARKTVGKLLGRSPSYDGPDTYKKLYDKASPELQKYLPKPGSFKVDDNTVALAEFLGGIEDWLLDVHGHQTGFDGRIPWNDPVLFLKHGSDVLIDLIKSAGKNARVVAAGVPMLCGRYYADSNPDRLTLKYAMALDRRFAEVYLNLYRQDPATAAKANMSLTGFDFSEKSTQDPVAYIVSMWKKYPGTFSFFGELTFIKEMVRQALGEHGSSLSSPKFLSMLRWMVKENIKAPIEVHNDMGHPDHDKAGRAAAIKMAYENVPEMIRVFGAEEFRGLNVIFAHTGIGRYVRPNDKPVTVSVIDRSTGKRIFRQVPEHIAEMYHVAEMVPNASFDISWNDVTQAYADNPELKKALVDFIVDNQDHIRILYGSDTVKPANTGHYNQGLYTGAPIFAEVARRDPEALWKILRSHAEKLLDEGEASVVDWTHRNLSDPKALAEMDERNRILAGHRARMLKGARTDFDNWIAMFKALDKPSPSSNPGVFPALYRLLPDAHDHDPPLEGANPAYGPVGRGTPGGYANEPPDANPIAKQAVRNNKIAGAGITAAGVGAGVAAMGHIGDHADALAFMGRGAALAVRALNTPKISALAGNRFSRKVM